MEVGAHCTDWLAVPRPKPWNNGGCELNALADELIDRSNDPRSAESSLSPSVMGGSPPRLADAVVDRERVWVSCTDAARAVGAAIKAASAAAKGMIQRFRNGFERRACRMCRVCCISRPPF